MRHIHADKIIVAANDTSIKWQYTPKAMDIWNDCIDGIPAWHPESEYRQRPAPHPHQAMIDQAEADPSIQWQYADIGEAGWIDCQDGSHPNFWLERKYRQKPAESKMVDMWQWSFKSRVTGGIFASNEYHADKPVDSLFNSSAPVCRIEGSKISVEVSQ
jgi:hypothetical protein